MTLRRGLVLTALAWSTSAIAGSQEDALAAYDKFFTSFTTGNQAATCRTVCAETLCSMAPALPKLSRAGRRSRILQ